MRSILVVLLVLAGTVPVNGCGAGDNGDSQQADGTGGMSGFGGAAAEPATDFKSFLLASSAAICERMVRCGAADESMAKARLLLGSAGSCESYLAQSYATSAAIGDLQDKLAGGSLRYVPEASSSCLGALASCTGVDSLNEGPCAEVIEGGITEGGACQRSEDCAGDAYCLFGDACPGQCYARKSAGSSCTVTDECAFDGGMTFCELDAESGPKCAVVEIGAAVSLGEACTVEPSAGAVYVPCQDELWCDPSDNATSGNGTCREPIEEGGLCNSGADVCQAGLWCGSSQGTCRAVTIQQAIGDACDEADYVICNPTLGLQCVSNTCAGGDGAEGSVCYRGELQRGCGSGLFCQPTDGVSSAGSCTPLLAAGRQCPWDGACVSGTCNDVCEAQYCSFLM
jgi:hypothetical protein